MLHALILGDAWPRVGRGKVTGTLRSSPEDFVVTELPLPMLADWRADQVLVEVRKRNLTTQWVAGGLARHFGVPLRDVGHAGLKDRRAVTQQYFSVRLPRALPLHPWYEPGTELLQLLRTRTALRPGDLAGNAFRICIRSVSDPELTDSRLHGLHANPILPNYFGPQRFGNGAGNVDAVRGWANGERQPAGRFERGLWLSSARALLFNLALAERVQAGDWDRSIAGEARLHGAASGPLWGRGKPLVAGAALARCQATWVGQALACALLVREGVRQDLRPWAMPILDLRWHWLALDMLSVEFRLAAGSYATTVLRELLPGNAQLTGSGRPPNDGAGMASISNGYDGTRENADDDGH